MQKLIQAIRLIKYSEMNEQAWEAYDSVINIAQTMLDKEKEAIIEAHQDGAFHTEWDEHTDIIENAQDYYNETFNTKDK